MYTDDDQFGKARAVHAVTKEGTTFVGNNSEVTANRNVHSLELNRGATFTIKNPYTLSGKGKAGEVAKILGTVAPKLAKMDIAALKEKND